MKRVLFASVLLAAIAAGLHLTGHLPLPAAIQRHLPDFASKADEGPGSEPPAPTVTVVLAKREPIADRVLVTGTLVAKREILIAPEVEGLRITELLAEEGDEVRQGQELAKLDRQVLIARLAENDAALARSDAAIAQAESNITQAEARNDEARKSLERARPLLASRALSESVYEQREAAARTAAAQLVAARDGLKVAKAERKQIEALRRELEWRLSKTTVIAPVAGIISRRTAKIGSVASAAVTSQPMFNLVKEGEIELDAEVPEAELGKIEVGQPALIALPGGATIDGKVRLVSPEIDRTTRLGSLRVALPRHSDLRVGGYARGTITTAVADSLTIPLTAVQFTPQGARVKVVRNNRVVSRSVVTGIQSDGRVEIRSGLAPDEDVVSKAGTFLRDGDAVNPVRGNGAKLSEVR
ncbi:MAG: hypothetical protein RLZ98_2829 [Pseudomonadota bacterium]|jgi:RND family efflux transporter MFP subunit